MLVVGIHIQQDTRASRHTFLDSEESSCQIASMVSSCQCDVVLLVSSGYRVRTRYVVCRHELCGTFHHVSVVRALHAIQISSSRTEKDRTFYYVHSDLANGSRTRCQCLCSFLSHHISWDVPYNRSNNLQCHCDVLLLLCAVCQAVL